MSLFRVSSRFLFSRRFSSGRGRSGFSLVSFISFTGRVSGVGGLEGFGFYLLEFRRLGSVGVGREGVGISKV